MPATLVQRLVPPRFALVPRVWVALGVSLALWRLLVLLCPQASELGFHAVAIGLAAVAAFSLAERRPKTLPARLPRWVAQVAATALAIPLAAVAVFAVLSPAGEPPFWQDGHLRGCFFGMNGFGLLVAPWIALGALVRQKEAFARDQALAFVFERSELERQALDARLHLMQAQVAPHFLFNTLANVQALVDVGSPQAPVVLRALIAYLRAAVPRLHEASTTLGRELDLAQAYLELMHMRMPDRLDYALHVDEAARGLACPPITLLTLVENAVRHGIDPAEDGGRIDVDVRLRGDRCLVQVRDTGIGLRAGGGGLGTGLATLRERLRLVFGDDVHLDVAARSPRGVRVALDFPARA